MKKGRWKVLVWILFVCSGVFLYLYYSDGLYAIDSKYKNKAIKDTTVIESEDPFDRRIDFEKLKNINEDVVAWVYVPGTTVDYPVLIGDTDDEYLYNDIERKYNPLGSIFSYCKTKKDLSDGHVILFGHNMRTYQMFGELKKFLNTDYMKEHRKFYVYTERKTLEFDIFSIFSCNENDDFFSTGRELGTAEYVSFLSELISRNKYSDYDIGDSSVSLSDSQVFSLATCYGVAGTSERLVVNGIAVKEKYIIE